MEPTRDPEAHREPDDETPARSGEHRIQQRPAADNELPPTPEVLTRRTRIITGVYSVIRPPRPR